MLDCCALRFLVVTYCMIRRIELTFFFLTNIAQTVVIYVCGSGALLRYGLSSG